MPVYEKCIICSTVHTSYFQTNSVRQFFSPQTVSPQAFILPLGLEITKLSDEGRKKRYVEGMEWGQ